jgi:hypothetical protein
MKIDADPVPDPAYHFDSDPEFYLMRIWMRIQVTKIMRIRIHNTVKVWLLRSRNITGTYLVKLV